MARNKASDNEAPPTVVGSSRVGTLGKAGREKTTDEEKYGGEDKKFPHRFFDFLIIVLLISSLAFIGYQEYQRRQTQKKLQLTSQKLEELKKVAEESGVLLSQEILTKVKKHIVIPDQPRPIVATIRDAEKFKENNPLFQSAKSGNHLIITEKRAILYDSERDIILDVVPVQPVQAEKTPPPEEGEKQREKEGKVETRR
jgi:hypothetical protein